MAHGKTLELRAIKAPEPTFIHQHPMGPVTKDGEVVRWVQTEPHVPYVNSARDTKRHARLRADLRVSS